MGLEINRQKYVDNACSLENHLTTQFDVLLPCVNGNLNKDIKYLIFVIKRNNYKKVDFQWIIGKI